MNIYRVLKVTPEKFNSRYSNFKFGTVPLELYVSSDISFAQSYGFDSNDRKAGTLVDFYFPLFMLKNRYGKIPRDSEFVKDSEFTVHTFELKDLVPFVNGVGAVCRVWPVGKNAYPIFPISWIKQSRIQRKAKIEIAPNSYPSRKDVLCRILLDPS